MEKTLFSDIKKIEQLLKENEIYLARIENVNAIEVKDKYPLVDGELPQGNYIISSMEVFIPIESD